MPLALSDFNECADPDLLLSPSSTLCPTSPVVSNLNMFTLPRLEISSLDTSPFSIKNAFHGLIEGDSDLLKWRKNTEAANDQDISYDIERYSNMKELVPGWDDDDVDEILIMCPKTERQLTTIEEESPRAQSISLADFEALPDHLRAANGGLLYRKHETGRLYALKSFTKLSKKSSSETDVLEILMDIKASFLPQIYCSFWNEDSFYMAMEYSSRETIREIVRYEGALKPERVRFFACEIFQLQALTVLHAAGIIHRDLRPENIIVDNAGHVVVEGFESSEILPYSSQTRDLTFCTTPPGILSTFSAPELLLGWSHDYLVDTWGFGMLLLFMSSGKYIFGHSEVSPIGWRKMIVYSPIVLPLLLETVAHDLISKCLERNSMARPSLLLIKKHRYFSAVDWKKVAAKRIRVPCSLHVPIDEDCSQIQSRLDRVVSSLPRARSRRFRTRSNVGSSEHGLKTSLVSTENLQALPNPTCEALLDDLRDTTGPMTLHPDPPVHSALSLRNASEDPLKLDVTSYDRLDSFWESLDTGHGLKSSETRDPPVLIHRPRKLRKSRSSIYPQHRVSVISTLSLQNLTRLGKLSRSTPSLPRPSTVVDLPEGIKQIGSGIGFKYDVPAATRSGISLCTNTPQTCHGFFNGRLHNFGFGLWRTPTVIAKAKAKRALKSLLISAREDDPQTFPTEFRGSNWSLVMPASQESRMSTSTELAGNSPISELAPLTPMTLECADIMTLAEQENSEESTEHENSASDALMTLRLVASSKSKAKF